VDQRAPAIVALRERRTTGKRLSVVLDRQPRVAGAAEKRRARRRRPTTVSRGNASATCGATRRWRRSATSSSASAIRACAATRQEWSRNCWTFWRCAERNSASRSP